MSLYSNFQAFSNSIKLALSRKADKTELSTKADKSEIPTVPTNVSAFENDADYMSEFEISFTDLIRVQDDLHGNCSASPEEILNAKTDGKIIKTGQVAGHSYLNGLIFDGINGDSTGVTMMSGNINAEAEFNSPNSVSFSETRFFVSISEDNGTHTAILLANEDDTFSKEEFESELSEKENKGKMTINSVEETVVTHTLSVTDSGVTTTYTLLGV